MRVLTVTSEAYDGFPRVLPPDFEEVRIPQLGESVYGSVDFWRKMQFKARAIYESFAACANGEVFIYVDADVSVYKPWEFFIERFAETDADVAFEFDKFHSLCSGFIMAVRSEYMLNVFANVATRTNGTCGDQASFIHEMQTIPHGVLQPKTVFSYNMVARGMWAGQHFSVPQGIGAFHASWCVGIPMKAALMDYVNGEVSKHG